MSAPTTTSVEQTTIDRIANAIESAEISYSMTLTRLVDGVATYRVSIDGEVKEFIDKDRSAATEQAYAHIRAVTQRRQAEAVISALSPPPAPQSTTTAIDAIMEQVQVFASTYSLAGGRFDDGTKFQQAEDEKAELHRMVEAFVHAPTPRVLPPEGVAE